ncbi:MAG: hypothetical protein RJQ01_03655 [Microcella sp.]|uniref:hypothetical protein n=1 Tax=Microcella sp. TaxID=1913979 RepID=UPI003314EC73
MRRSFRSHRAVASVVAALVLVTAAAGLSSAALANEAQPAPAPAESTETGAPSEPQAVVDAEESSDLPEQLAAESDAPPEAASVAPAEGAPPVPSITSPPSGVLSLSRDVQISGTVASELDLIVTVEAYAVEGGDFLGFCEVPVPGVESAWVCELNLGSTHTGAASVIASSREDVGESPSGDESDPVLIDVQPGLEAQFTSHEGFSNSFVTQTIELGGAGPAGGSVQVEAVYYPYLPSFGGETTVEFCSSSVALSGEWQCTGGPLENGGAPYYDYVYFQVFSTDFFGFSPGESYDDEIGGDVELPSPELDYELAPATISVTAVGETDADLVVELYTAEPNGEGYNFAFIDSCGGLPGEGGEGGEEEWLGPAGAPLASATSELECTFEDLAAGVWNLYYAQALDGVESAWTDDYVRIPEAPTLASTLVNADRTVRVSGTGTPGFRVHVLRNANTAPSCSATVSSGGAWTCTVSPPSGTSTFRAVQESIGFEPEGGVSFGSALDGFSQLTAPLTVTVPAPPAPLAPPAPQSPAGQTVVPTPGTVEISGVPDDVRAGTELEIQGTTECIAPIVCDVDVDIFSTPQRLGSTVTQPDGVFGLRVAVPQDLEPGEHTIVVTVTPRGGTGTSVSQPITVAPASTEPVAVEEPSGGPVDEEQPEASASADGTTGNLVRDDPAAPSALTTSIPTMAEIFRNPIVTITAGGLALAILLLVAFPTELLNSTLSANTRRFGKAFARFESGVDRITDWFAAVTRTRATAAAVLIVITAVIFGFVDPSFGFDAVSVRLTLALAIGLFLVTYVASWISAAIIWRVWRFETSIGLQPAALVFAVIGVVVARLLDFSPGFLVGLVIGLEIVARVDAPHRVRAVLTQLGVMVGISVLAWVGYSILTESTSGALDWVTALSLDTLAAATAEGLTAAAVAILPLGFLEGREIFQRSKALWIGAFLVTASLFALLVLPTEDGIDEISNVGTWLLVLVGFAVVTLTLWAVLHYTNPDRHAVDERGSEPEDAVREDAAR